MTHIFIIYSLIVIIVASGQMFKGLSLTWWRLYRTLISPVIILIIFLLTILILFFGLIAKQLCLKYINELNSYIS